MISLKYNPKYDDTMKFYGLSTDEKPLDTFKGIKLMNASYFYEMDTSISYFFDAENKIWYMKLN